MALNGRLLGAALAVLAGSAVCGLAASEPTVADILPRAQAAIHEFFVGLPSFVCTETVDSETLVSSKESKKTHVVSSFTGLQQRSGRSSFTETRKKLSINGTPVPEGGKEPILKGVFHFGGGFSSVLDESFSPKSVTWQRYKIGGTELVAGEECIVLEAETDDATSKLSLDWFGKTVRASATTRAWISRDSAGVLKLERQYSGLPGNTTLHVSVDYSMVEIGMKRYLMPQTVRAWTTVAGSGRQETSTYVATYSGYRKFDVATDITYQ